MSLEGFAGPLCKAVWNNEENEERRKDEQDLGKRCLLGIVEGKSGKIEGDEAGETVTEGIWGPDYCRDEELQTYKTGYGAQRTRHDLDMIQAYCLRQRHYMSNPRVSRNNDVTRYAVALGRFLTCPGTIIRSYVQGLAVLKDHRK
jgi:hypothetical protein